MMGFDLHLNAISDRARTVDHIFFTLTALSATVLILAALIAFFFCVHYRRGKRADRAHPPISHLKLEIAWSVTPLLILLSVGVWAAKAYLRNSDHPDDAVKIWVVGKQWMWKTQYEDGRREINDVHVLLNQDILLYLSSEDVIHSFFVPELRIKQDLLPGRYTSFWFRADREGDFAVRCAQFCGTEHSVMNATLHVLSAENYKKWLNDPVGAQESAPQRGALLFHALRCQSCHSGESTALGPTLTNLYQSEVMLRDGHRELADVNYLRRSITDPNSQIVEGYKAVMPTYAGQLKEEQMNDLLSFLMSLRSESAP